MIDTHDMPDAPAESDTNATGMPPEPPAGRRPGLLRRYVAVAVRPRTWGNLAWLLLALPLGIATFVFAIAGFSLGLGLSVTIIGIPLLVAMLFATRALASAEGRMASALLGAQIPPTPFAAPPARPGLMARIAANLRDSLTWRGLLFMLLRLPLGIAAFTTAVTLLAIVAALIAAPLTYDGASVQLFSLRADSLWEAFACFAVGLLLAPAALHALNGLGWLMGRIARVLLAPGATRAGATA